MGRRVANRRGRDEVAISEALGSKGQDDRGGRRRGGQQQSSRHQPTPQGGQQPVQGRGTRFRKGFTPKTDKQADMWAALELGTVLFALGPAGTGKTHVAVTKAVEWLATGAVERIVLARPAIEAAGERLGFLPGDMEEKLSPYMRPLYDALYDGLGIQAANAMLSNGQVEIAPLAFMRGRTFKNCAVIVDEAQNCTRGQLKMALTRLGEGSRMILTGDPDQNDLEPGDSGLELTAADLEGAPGIEVIRFDRSETVRSRIVAQILELI